MSNQLRNFRKELVAYLTVVESTSSAADPKVRTAVRRLISCIQDALQANGIRKAELINAANSLVMPPYRKAVLAVPEVVRMVSPDVLVAGLSSLQSAYELSNEVSASVEAPGLYFTPEMQMACETTDLLVEVAHCIFAWPQSTINRDGLRSRVESFGSPICRLCHRPSQLYTHWHGLATASAGIMVGTRFTNEHAPDKRLSTKYCDDHSKSNRLRSANAGRYSAASRTRSSRLHPSGSDLRSHLQERGLAVTYSARIPVLLGWMLIRPTNAKRDVSKWRANYPNILERTQRTIDLVLPLPLRYRDLLAATEDLLEINVYADGEIQRVLADGSTQSQTYDSAYQFAQNMASIRRALPLGYEHPVEVAWSEDLGIEVTLIGKRLIRLAFVSPVWLALALEAPAKPR